MKGIYINNREGQTVLSPKERKGLRQRHITNLQELNEAEQININKGLLWLTKQRGEVLSDTFFRKLHSRLFGDVWKWAGSYRTSEKNIGIDYWKVPGEIQKLCDDCEYWLEHETYDWSELIARFHHRMVYIHPFPNGNGRFARIIANHLCRTQGKSPPKWGMHLSPEERRKTYIEALRKADLKDYKGFIHFLVDG